MLELAAYILKERRTDSASLFELLETETGELAGFAQFEIEKPWQPSRFHLWQQSLIDKHRWLRTGLAVCLALIFLPFLVLSSLFRGKLPVRERPRLSLKDAVGGTIVFTIRQSAGMFYDSRVVLDGEGRLVALLRGPSKISLGRMSFGIIDLGGNNQAAKDYGDLPWLGWVDPSEPGVYRVSLVGLKDAGRIVERDTSSEIGHYIIEAKPELREHRGGLILLIAVALAMAWTPPP